MQMTEERKAPSATDYLERKLQWDAEDLRRKLIERGRSLAERLTRLADGLEADPDYSFNTIGELQGNGVELDTWCAKLGQSRELLKLFRQAQESTRE